MQSHAPAVLLLLFLTLHGATAASSAQQTDASCAPASCGSLTIAYPFWLRGHHGPSCGYPSFGVTCSDDLTAPPSLNDSYLRVLDIRYGNRSVVAFHENLVSGGSDPCRAARFNVSTSLALSPLAVRSANWELFFRDANCSRAPPPTAGALRLQCPGNGAWSVRPGRTYEPEYARPVEPSKYSVVPVLPGSELRTLDDYAGIVKRGFLLEWTVPGDCAACNATGGGCRYDAGANAFGCLCPGDRLQPATCGDHSRC